ncbi:hypothetical protein [Xylophilus sp. Leaf220]|uniref:hypothetical protein n=1 Tax=Xylophilus sp. Leaf220 TaxID=1735686 RepID=UPI0006FA17A0|nr:hypothetical protein [Xylophilus sp. Leaf220]KQM75505.1 phospholipase [Xylophilus sp. Leaf220]
MQALRIYAGSAARRHLERHGLQPSDVQVIPAAAGGPKGLVLGRLDRYLFGDWLPKSGQPVALVGASIGAWRMATACLPDPVAGFARLERDYIGQRYDFPAGRGRPLADDVSAQFAASLHSFYDGRVPALLAHPRYRLHVLAARGRMLLTREHRWATPAGYLGAFVSNLAHRRALGAWIERVVFSAGEGGLPFGTGDFPTRRVPLDAANFHPALQASCSIPFALRAVAEIPGAPPGAYWDGGITDYHLHLQYDTGPQGLVLYPHFQRAVVPGWLDKALRWRHRPTGFLDRMMVLAPDPAWIATLPRGKLPDRQDFVHFRNDHDARAAAWTAAAGASQQLADEFDAWLARPDMGRVQPL